MMGGFGDDILDRCTAPRRVPSVWEDRKLTPDPQGMESTMHFLPVWKVQATVIRGWWEVKVQCEPAGPYYSGKKGRSYFSALAKALDAAMVGTGHRAL